MQILKIGMYSLSLSLS